MAEEIAKEKPVQKNSETRAKKKSKVKAAGLKSTLVLDEERLLLTSFGRGNAALKDKYVVKKAISDASNAAVLKVSSEGKHFRVSGRVVADARTDNPLESTRPIGMDQIRCKGKLEQIVFGKTYPDNIHIQAIYKILDIEKILTVHINNIVFEINNLLREEGDLHDDLIGYLSDRDSYEKFRKKDTYELFRKLLQQRQLGYFGEEFLPLDKKGNPLQGEAREQYERKMYYLLAVLGTVRQATAHGEEGQRAKLFQLDRLTKNQEIGEQLENFYRDKIRSLNAGFAKNMEHDLTILFEIVGAATAEEKRRIAKEFFDFTVLKSYKNMGFSIKYIRENFAKLYPEMTWQKYDTVRQKVNKFMDYFIWQYYKANPQRQQKLVERLRASGNDEEKERLYRSEAQNVWHELGGDIKSKLMPKMSSNYYKNLPNKNADAWKAMQGNCLSADCSSFSRMIFLLTAFLDGKEINDLLTQLINNFECIDSFVSLMKSEGIECEFTDRYQMFNQSMKISRELRIINSVARMSSASESTKKTLFIEAAHLLGYDEQQNILLDDYLDNMLKKDPNGKKGQNGFRNFIINNVIKSNRFQYLMRYGHPDNLRQLANNRKVVDFVLREIPDAQIKAFYNSCTSQNSEYDASMREALAKIITRLSFRDFENVHQGRTSDKTLIADKERKKNIVRLYLTVLYLLVKNLIYVNSRYYLAFHCVERDALLYDKDTYRTDLERKEFRSFATHFVNEHSTNQRAKTYINHNIGNSDAWACRTFRNCVDHMNAIRNAHKYINDIREVNSYFELYHYLMQRSIMDQYEYDSTHESKKFPGTYIITEEQLSSRTLFYFEVVRKYRTYCKDFVKALNVPFAYNLARYKNLSIKELFDRNHYLPREAEKLSTRDTEYEL